MKQTNSLQKSYDPFANGRWYRVFLESNGTVFKITESDIKKIKVDGNVLVFYKTLITFVERINLVKTKENINTSINYYVHTDVEGVRYSLFLPKANQCDYCEVLLFCED